MSITVLKARTRYRTYINEPYNSIATYTTGTAYFTTATTAVTGVGTAWLTNCKAGQTFHMNGAANRYYTIYSVNSNTSLTLTESIAEATILVDAAAEFTISAGRTTEYTAIDDLNMAHRKLVAEIENIDENYFSTTGTISYDSGTERYSLPTTNGTIKKIENVYRTDTDPDKQLHPINKADRTKYLVTSTSSSINNLDERYYLHGQYIGIVPIPTTSATDNLTIEYIPEATDKRLDTDTYMIPDFAENWLCLEAASYRTNNPIVLAQLGAERQYVLTTCGRNVQESQTVQDLTDWE